MIVRNLHRAMAGALKALSFGVALTALTGPEPAAAEASGRDQVTITWTAHGIPHIVASDFRRLGYGYGYAMARNDVCGMADMFATFSGERALRFGADKADLVRMLGRRPINNVASDFARRLVADDALVAAAKAALTPQLRGLVAGYADGFDHYVATTPAEQLPAGCRQAGMVHPITEDDVLRRLTGMATLLSSGLLLQELYDAAPPTGADRQASLVPPQDAPERILAGSNAYAFGRDVTGGPGLLLGNPHFFWDGPDRFVEAHLTIPGRYDVMGVALQGMPLIAIGFNHSVAWSHTVSTDARGAVYALSLDPADPTRYLVDGQSIAMTRQRVSIAVRQADGVIAQRSHVFWITRFGPVIASPALPWTNKVAYALADADRDNYRMLQQWLEIGESRDVRDLKRRLERVNGLPWVNTVAADKTGEALYADISVAPDLDADKLKACRAAFKFAYSDYLVALDGSKSACAWTRETDAAQPGVIPSALKPSLLRQDYVENSNGSYWLVNPAQPLEGFSPVVGPERTPLNFRTRQGHLQVQDRLAGRDGLPARAMSASAIEQILFSGRSLQAELVVDDLVRACRTTLTVTLKDGAVQDLSQACEVLARWDRHYNLDSVGAPLFSAFVARAKTPGTEDLGENDALWRTPFDPNDPVNTPRGLNTDNPRILAALGEAVRALKIANIPLDARLGDVQFVERDGARIPLHGGATFSAIAASLRPGQGFTEPMNPSNSYIQVVGFDRTGPVADAVLVTSQTPDPASAFHADQTLLYAQKRWVRLPFEPSEVTKAAIGAPLVLQVPQARP
jgi:acyl-homoserine-lactone acylase